VALGEVFGVQQGVAMSPKRRKEMVEALHYKHEAWFESLPPDTADTLLALAKQFEKSGTEELENPYVLNAPEVVRAEVFKL